MTDGRRSDLGLLAMWISARVRLLLRVRRATFFTFVFPLMFLVIFNALNSGNKITTDLGRIGYAQYFTPSIGVFGLVTGCYTALIFGVATAREQGVLRRISTTPLPPWIYLASMLVASLVTGLGSVLLMFAVGVPAFGVHIIGRLLPAAIVTVVVGGASLAALGLAVSTLVDKAESAPAVANLTMLPLTFISGVFYPLHGAPHLLLDIAHFFPLSHIVEAFTACFDPRTQGSGFNAGDLGVCAIWGVVGIRIAAWRFNFDPTDDSRRRLHLPFRSRPAEH